MTAKYENVKARVLLLRSQGKLAHHLTQAERADWAYGTTKIENDDVTRKMANEAVQKKDRR